MRNAFCFVLVLFCVSVVSGQEWTRFRGPNGQGVSSSDGSATIPVKLGEENLCWKIELAGGGHSSPVLWGDKVFVTSGDQKARKGFVQAFGAKDGKLLWEKEYSLGSYRVNSLNSYATGTPSVDADGIYILFPMEQESFLIALDHAGEEIWKKPFAGVKSAHGPGNSTIVVGDIVVFAHEQRDTEASAKGQWIAVDRKTGKTRWTIDRRNTTNVSYSTPCLYEGNLVFPSHAHGLTGVDPVAGKIVWEVEGTFEKRVVASPAIAGELIFGSSGQGGGGKHLVAVKPGDRNGSKGEIAYKLDGATAAYVPTALGCDGMVFTFHDRGDVCCIRAATGDILWTAKPGGRFYGSPGLVGERIYCITREGTLVVIKAADKYELLAISDLGEMSHATPAIAGGRIYLRTFSHLSCY